MVQYQLTAKFYNNWCGIVLLDYLYINRIPSETILSAEIVKYYAKRIFLAVYILFVLISWPTFVTFGRCFGRCYGTVIVCWWKKASRVVRYVNTITHCDVIIILSNQFSLILSLKKRLIKFNTQWLSGQNDILKLFPRLQIKRYVRMGMME